MSSQHLLRSLATWWTGVHEHDKSANWPNRREHKQSLQKVHKNKESGIAPFPRGPNLFTLPLRQTSEHTRVLLWLFYCFISNPSSCCSGRIRVHLCRVFFIGLGTDKADNVNALKDAYILWQVLQRPPVAIFIAHGPHTLKHSQGSDMNEALTLLHFIQLGTSGDDILRDKNQDLY